jgi:FKBP-type peptidyl-prolyl cis-trans isomerase
LPYSPRLVWPADAAANLRDTSVKPEIPRPAGSPARRLVKEDIVKGKGPAAGKGDVVTVQCVGVSFSTGAQFDASCGAQGFPPDIAPNETLVLVVDLIRIR